MKREKTVFIAICMTLAAGSLSAESLADLRVSHGQKRVG